MLDSEGLSEGYGSRHWWKIVSDHAANKLAGDHERFFFQSFVYIQRTMAQVARKRDLMRLDM